jgi:hypothetical protein
MEIVVENKPNPCHVRFCDLRRGVVFQIARYDSECVNKPNNTYYMKLDHCRDLPGNSSNYNAVSLKIGKLTHIPKYEEVRAIKANLYVERES